MCGFVGSARPISDIPILRFSTEKRTFDSIRTARRSGSPLDTRRGGKQGNDRLWRSNISRIVQRQASIAIRSGWISPCFQEKTDDRQAFPHDGVEQWAGLLITDGIGVCPTSQKRLHSVRITPSAHRVKHGIPEVISLVD